MSVFFSSRKTVLKKWLDTSSIASYLSSFLSLFLIATPTAPRYLVDQSRMLLPPRYLVDWSSFCSWIWFLVGRYLLDTSAVDDHFLDTYLDSFLDTSQHLHLSSFTEGLYIPSSQSESHFFDLCQSVCTCSSPKHHLSHSKPLPLYFSSFFKIFLLLVSF